MPKRQHAEHIGCHVDAPNHTVPDQMHASIETVALERLVAEAVVYDFSDREWKPGEDLTPSDIEPYERANGHFCGCRRDRTRELRLAETALAA
ncbi:cyclase family protein [Bradyrhizobium sp. CW9]|nr:cyclase family protein [Bradyrhizobium sp. CW9]